MPTATTAPTVAPASVQWTLDAYLKTPRIISRDLTALAVQNFVADRVFTRGTPEQVAGGNAVFQKSESIYLDSTRDFEEIGVRSKFPRAGWSEDLFTAAVHQYGLEVPISYLSIRRNARDIAARALKKLANNSVKFIDTKMFVVMNAEVTAGNAQTTAATATWAGGSAKILKDFANARLLINKADQGYNMDTVLLSNDDLATLVTDPGILSVLARESGNQASTGEVSQILGIRQIIGTNRLAQGTAWFLEAGTVGTIADEQPDPQEGYAAYDPGADSAQLWVRTYDDVDNSQWVIRCMRSPAMWIAEPKALVKMTGL
jgi:hypothetical protein